MSALLTPPGTVTPPPRYGTQWRMTVAEFYRCGESGFFPRDVRVELINGYVVQQMAPKPPHESTMTRLNQVLLLRLPNGWFSRGPASIELSESVPIPDAVAVRGNNRSFDRRHPAPADFGILFAVSDSSLAYDRTDKLELYAAEGIPEYWIVNIPDRQIEVYSQPQSDGTYASRKDFAVGSAVPVVLDGQRVFEITVDEIL